MESRKKGLYTANMCRFCLSQNESLLKLFEKKQPPTDTIPLSLKILSSISVEVFPSEKMPPYICRRCNFFMDVVYNFKNICREADKSILDYVQTGAALEPIAWKPSLVNLFHHGCTLKDTNVLKIEGGATVEVSQSMTDSEDENENVYNVKIGDGSEEMACVKVVTGKDTEKSSKAKAKKDVNVSVDCGMKPSTEGCWACDECDCTYPLEQLLDLHKMQKHRARTFACDECDAKFFTKQDLASHTLTHSTELPFECVACDKKFKRNILLKRHEKLAHADLPQLPCDHCPASFLSEEELEIHLTRHKRKGERRWTCIHCDKEFYEQTALHKHIDVVHESKPEFACEYCPERFTSITKLTRHVRTHAGERPYPCKYCDKSFTKSHHYTRHIRVKHGMVSGESRGPVEEFRCEQCAVSFPTQDELIYHSAIHATQNLTCPLCQEKFHDVDAVTAHIKSHVTGMEFMCDFCELVFTSKEKLDLHIESVHDDELRNVQELVQDESSMENIEMEGEEDDDNSINLKEEGDHMVVEIKKPDEFLLSSTDNMDNLEEKTNNTNSEVTDSEPESSFMEQLPAVVSAPPARPPPPPLTPAPAPAPVSTPAPAPIASKPDAASQNATASQTLSILRKAEEVKRKLQESPAQEKKEKPKVENSTGGASDKSLRLLEKELQELQRTNKREEPTKMPAKSLESLRNRRPQIHTSTPKLRSTEEKKSQVAKSTPVDKKLPERRAVKENKKPEDSKEAKTNNVSCKEEKETKAKEDSIKVKEEKEPKNKEDKETKSNAVREESKDKSVVKNGANTSSNKSATEDVGPVRRSSRPSRVKDYAKMVNSKADTTPSDEDTDDDDEEYVDMEEPPRKMRQKVPKPATPKSKPHGATGATPAAPATPAPAKKRGRPRKDAGLVAEVTPAKVIKTDKGDKENDDSKSDKMEIEDVEKPKQISEQDSEESEESFNTSQESTKSSNAEQKPSNVIVAPKGQMKKVLPIKALPPGVKPLPLPVIARPEISEMQIGKKMVKVQKIVMTKAEVEAMAKKGLVEMKDGTMVLKAGVKIPTDPTAIKSSLVGDGQKNKQTDSPSKIDRAAPTRCDLDEV